MRGTGAMARSGSRRGWGCLGVAVCAALLTTTTPAAQASRFAYVGDAGASSVVPFAIGAGGQLAALTPAPMAANADPMSLAATPDGRYVYAADYNNNAVVEFAVNADGTLSSLGSVSVGTGSPSDIAVSPDGRSVYVASYDVYQFTVGSDGRLTPKAVPFVADAHSAYSVVVSPDGRHAYAANDANGTIAQYNVAGDGSLTPMIPAEVSAGGGTNIIYLVLTPRSLFGVINGTPAQVAQLTIGADGKLTPNSPATVATGTTPWGAAVSPNDGFLWVATNAGVSQYAITSQGTLSPMSPAIVTGATGGYRIWPTADGASVYVPDANTGVDQLDASPTGALSPKSPSSASTGNPASATHGIVVLPDQGPVASFVASPAAPGSPTAFDGSGSMDVDGSIARYDWEFGDGTGAIDAGAHPSHTYAAPGTYTVRLAEFDDAGCAMYEIYTGHTAYCAGTAAAIATHSVTIEPPAVTGPHVVTPPVIAEPPLATTGATRGIGLHAATLTGTVNAGGQPTTYRFDYGLTTRYGLQTPPVSPGSASTPVAVQRTVSGLARGHTYHYRLVATDASGTSTGADRTFTTPSATGAITVQVSPRRALGPPYHYVFSGRLALPRGMSRKTGCRGQVSVQIKTGPNTISNHRATIRSTCAWRLAVAVSSSYHVGNRLARLGRSGSLRVVVSFLGSQALAAHARPAFTVRFG
jgi:6-phosphogluconolactonase (cycloisomerase 2 family)